MFCKFHHLSWEAPSSLEYFCFKFARHILHFIYANYPQMSLQFKTFLRFLSLFMVKGSFQPPITLTRVLQMSIITPGYLATTTSSLICFLVRPLIECAFYYFRRPPCWSCHHYHCDPVDSHYHRMVFVCLFLSSFVLGTVSDQGMPTVHFFQHTEEFFSVPNSSWLQLLAGHACFVYIFWLWKLRFDNQIVRVGNTVF